jgi:hypothetical protein
MPSSNRRLARLGLGIGWPDVQGALRGTAKRRFDGSLEATWTASHHRLTGSLTDLMMISTGGSDSSLDLKPYSFYQSSGVPHMDITETVHKALLAGQDWARVSKLAHTTGLPVEEVRRALRTLAMTGRASRTVRPMDERFIELWTVAKPRERT